nr:MAG TPA: hypothetical protein [Caudoviricetes sp.]
MTVEELRRILADLPSDARVWVEAGLDDDHNGWWASHVTQLPGNVVSITNFTIPDYPPRG